VLFTVPMKDGTTQLLHIGDGGMFDNQGIESMAQLMFGKLRTKSGEQPSPRRGLVVLIDASYPFDGSGGLLSEAKSLLQLLDRSPSRVYDIMEQRAQAYQLMLWTVLRADAARRDAHAAGNATEGQVVPDTKHLRVIYLRHTDAAASMQVPPGCDVTGSGEGARGSAQGKVEPHSHALQDRLEVRCADAGGLQRRHWLHRSARVFWSSSSASVLSR
jgi:hypothetical protein